jgi:hypothetical protein
MIKPTSSNIGKGCSTHGSVKKLFLKHSICIEGEIKEGLNDPSLIIVFLFWGIIRKVSCLFLNHTIIFMYIISHTFSIGLIKF